MNKVYIIMKTALILLLFPLWVSAQISKDELINKTINAIQESKAGSYESIYTNYQQTEADTMMKWYYAGKLSYEINDYDTLCGMNYSFEKREKTFNFDRIERQVYNGYYYYANQDILDDMIPDVRYNLFNLQDPNTIKVLRKHVDGQIPQIFRVLKSYPKDQITMAPDTIVNNQKFYQLRFKDENPFFGYVVWVDAKSYLPFFVYRYGYTTKKPQLLYANELRNYTFREQGNKEFISETGISQFVVDANQIDTETTQRETVQIKEHKKIHSLATEIKVHTVTGESLYLSPNDKKIRLLYFGLLNCCPCVKSTTHLIQVDRTFHANDNFEMCAFYPYDPPEIVKKYVKDNNLNYPVCAGNKQIVKDYGLHTFPDFLLIDKDGKLYKWYRYSDKISDVLITDIKKLIAR
ncbi:TlpA family protein disulfide reductase [Gaoshiqia sp. Z1-71]|uniref:TlpA family protein disulfide reductase n=1 Tax=Gaoshiqia hydrogeniformans TaxID=3290090 RepID=UPI003BF8CC43